MAVRPNEKNVPSARSFGLILFVIEYLNPGDEVLELFRARCCVPAE